MGDQEKKKITRHTELDVYQKAFAAAMQIFELSKSFPSEEKYSLTDQYADLRVRSVQIKRKPGASGFIKLTLRVSLPTAKRKQLKHKLGFSLLSNVST
jgi:hypothetical protein